MKGFISVLTFICAIGNVYCLTYDPEGLCGTFGPNYYCYWYPIDTTHSYNFYDARQYCLDLNSDLTSINSGAENNLILELTRQAASRYFWIGYYRDLLMDDNFVWIDNSTSSYQNWRSCPSSNPRYTVVYLIRDSVGGWYTTIPLESGNTPICKKLCNPNGITTNDVTCSFTSYPKRPDKIATFCSNSTSTKYCYMVPTEGKQKWMDSRTICQIYGSDLASIGSSEENDFIVANMPVTTKTHYFNWNDTGDYSNDTAQFWIGYYQDVLKNGTWQWSDQSSASYNNWARSYPDLEDLDRKTTAVLSAYSKTGATTKLTGTWVPGDPANWEALYICKKACTADQTADDCFGMKNTNF